MHAVGFTQPQSLAVKIGIGVEKGDADCGGGGTLSSGAG